MGSHLCEALVARGDEVICVDNFCTGLRDNIVDLESSPLFSFRLADVSKGVPLEEPVDAVVHLACPASPPDYLAMPLETLAVTSRGTEAALESANRWNARFLLASTSEVYGEPLVHPQSEQYWGNVHCTGPRSVYDEGKRFAEALTMAYRRVHAVNTGIVRIFNTYGPRMRPEDGRVVSNFVAQALKGEPLTVYGDGSQTRSFCYVEDLVAGLVRMLDSDESGPINLGNPIERTVAELAELVISITGSTSTIVHNPLPVDDPSRRRPDITLATTLLQWEPTVGLEDGLERCAKWTRQRLDLMPLQSAFLSSTQVD